MPAKRRVSEPGAERVTLARLPWLPGVEVLRAENSQRCWRVYHEGYSFCTPDPGWDALASWRYRGREHAMAAHTQQLFEPGEAHHTFKVGGPPVAFDVLLLEPSLVANWLGRQPPHLQPRSDDPHLQVLLRRACAAIRNAADPLRVELALSRCVGALFAEASEGPGPCAEPRLGDWRVKRVREMIHDGAGDALRLEPLASEVGLSAARLVTLFRQCTSLPVHQYITALRLTKVMRQMARGVAVRCGHRVRLLRPVAPGQTHAQTHRHDTERVLCRRSPLSGLVLWWARQLGRATDRVMVVAVPRHRHSFQDYLAVEEMGPVRHEFLGGNLRDGRGNAGTCPVVCCDLYCGKPLDP